MARVACSLLHVGIGFTIAYWALIIYYGVDLVLELLWRLLC